MNARKLSTLAPFEFLRPGKLAAQRHAARFNLQQGSVNLRGRQLKIPAELGGCHRAGMGKPSTDKRQDSLFMGWGNIFDFGNLGAELSLGVRASESPGSCRRNPEDPAARNSARCTPLRNQRLKIPSPLLGYLRISRGRKILGQSNERLQHIIQLVAVADIRPRIVADFSDGCR